MPMLVDVLLPEAPEQGSEALVERWLHQPGDAVRLHEPLLEINTDKAIVEVPAPASGVLREILKAANESIAPGEVVGRIEVTTEAGHVAATRPAVPPPGKTAPAAAEQRLSPAVRQLLKKHRLDPAQVPGTGRDGRITHADVLAYVQQQAAGSAAKASRRLPHTPLRRQIAQHMVQSVQTAPHVTAVFEADLSAVVTHRQREQEAARQQGIRLTYTAYFVAAAVQALQAVPEVNSRWHEEALELFADCNVGIATAVEGGLLVPVLHRAQALDLFGIARRLEQLTDQARAGKLQPADLRDGTFTITNHGVSGSLIATPILHQPQTAILGIGKIEKRLIVVEEKGKDTLHIQPMAYVTLTIDHRALDGFQANAFLNQFVKSLACW